MFYNKVVIGASRSLISQALNNEGNKLHLYHQEDIQNFNLTFVCVESVLK